MIPKSLKMSEENGRKSSYFMSQVLCLVESRCDELAGHHECHPNPSLMATEASCLAQHGTVRRPASEGRNRHDHSFVRSSANTHTYIHFTRVYCTRRRNTRSDNRYDHISLLLK